MKGEKRMSFVRETAGEMQSAALRGGIVGVGEA
jgi:hypothetical protein